MNTNNSELLAFKNWIRDIRNEMQNPEDMNHIWAADLYHFFKTGISASDMADLIFNYVAYTDDGRVEMIVFQPGYINFRRNIDLTKFDSLRTIVFSDANEPTETEIEKFDKIPHIDNVFILTDSKSAEIDSVADLQPVDMTYATNLDRSRKYHLNYYLIDTADGFEQEY